MLSVDGVQCLVGGVPVLTNADGKFSILVPMGPHYITAAKAGHTFAYNGRYPEDPNNAGVTYEFLHDINDLRFYDNTKLLLVGRVAGGDEEQHKPHGMHLGKGMAHADRQHCSRRTRSDGRLRHRPQPRRSHLH